MAKKVNLPLFSHQEKPAGEPSKKPSIDAARARLGGRLADVEPPPTGFAPGVVVRFATPTGRRTPGVVVFASRSEVHVLLDAIRLRRLPPEKLELYDGTIDDELGKIAADARLFGLLVESQAVRYADGSGALVDAKVIEKCRWGAIVLREDGAIVAVGFRKLWPSPGEGRSA